MPSEMSYRELAHQQLRTLLLDTARALVVSGGWGRVRMSSVAASAGVSRQTLYNEFGSKEALAQALVVRETETFLRGLAATLDNQAGSPRQALAGVVVYALRSAGDAPLLKAILTSADNALLPLLTTDVAPVLAAARGGIADYLKREWPQADAASTQRAAEWLTRLTVSYLAFSTAPAEQVGAELADLVGRYLDAAAH